MLGKLDVLVALPIAPIFLQLAFLSLVILVWVLDHLLWITTFKSPSQDGIISEGFNYCNYGLFVAPQHFNYLFASVLENAVNSAGLHVFDQHSSKSEGYFFRVLFSFLGSIKTVAKVNVDNFSSVSLNHDIVRMTVAQPNDESNYRHDS